MSHYTLEFKKEIVRLHLEEGRTLASISTEYNIAKSTICKWVKEFNKECQTNTKAMEELNYMQENLRLRKELAESKKENEFLKKAAAFFAKEIG